MGRLWVTRGRERLALNGLAMGIGMLIVPTAHTIDKATVGQNGFDLGRTFALGEEVALAPLGEGVGGKANPVKVLLGGGDAVEITCNYGVFGYGGIGSLLKFGELSCEEEVFGGL